MFRGAAVFAGALAVLAAPVAAQHLTPDWVRCDNRGRPFPLDTMISACTVVLDSGRLTIAERAIAYFNRGDAFQDKGDNERAIADFEAAIKLNPRDVMAYQYRGIAYQSK